MRKINVGKRLLKNRPNTTIRSLMELESTAGVFELAHSPSLNSNGGPFDDHDQRNMESFLPKKMLKLYKSSDMSFTKAFLTHHYIGVPEFIVRKSDLSEVIVMRWHISHPDHTSGLIMEMAKLDRLIIQMSLPNTKIPALHCPNLEGINTVVLAHNVDISSLWCSCFPELHCFVLYQSRSLTKTKDSKKRPVTLTQENWQSFIEKSGLELAKIDISGFLMPFLSESCVISTELKRPSVGRNFRDFYRGCQKTTLHPIIASGTRSYECKLVIGAREPDSHWRNIHPRYSQAYVIVCPIFEDPSDRGRVNLTLKGVRDISSLSLRIHTSSSDWSSVDVDGNVLEVPQDSRPLDEEKLDIVGLEGRSKFHQWDVNLWESLGEIDERVRGVIWRRMELLELIYKSSLYGD